MRDIGATIGDGGSADAFRILGTHGIKLQERRTQLLRLMASGELDVQDWKLARELVLNIQRALEGR